MDTWLRHEGGCVRAGVTLKDEVATLTGLCERMEALLTRLEGYLTAASPGGGAYPNPSGASVHYHVTSPEQMAADQKAIEDFIHRQRLGDAE